jgi:hypothetical protein
MDEIIHAPRIFGRNIAGYVKVLDLASKLDREGAGIKLGNEGDAGAASQNILPGFFDGVSDWANDAKTGDYNSATCQGALLMQM